MPDPVPALSDRVLLERYRLVRLIARGGMAEVWEGHDEVLARPVALKVLHAHLAGDEAFVERFRREAVAAARLAHPGIVATYDAGTDGDVAFIVMELVRGQTLRQALAEVGTLPSSIAVPLAAEVADALEHAHQAGLVHRDVKPANMLLTEHEGMTGPLLRVKVADFGIARMDLDSEGALLTEPGAVVGTAAYLSPEQVQGLPPDARSDAYALGVVLYEMLCGRPPFQADTDVATALQHVRSEPMAPSRREAGISPALDTVVLRAMAKDPGDRYQSAAELRDALLALDGVEPEDDAVPHVVRHATPPAGTVPVPRPPERRRGPLVALLGLAAAAAVALAVAIGGGGAGRGGGATSGGGPGTALDIRDPLSVASASSFDPQGTDGQENEERVGLAFDGNPATAWNTDTYDSRPFGGLKQGVGLVIRLARPGDLRHVHVRSRTTGWAAAVYVADEPGIRLADWGKPQATERSIEGDATFDLPGGTAGAVLLWITDPGPSRRVDIAEVAVSD